MDRGRRAFRISSVLARTVGICVRNLLPFAFLSFLLYSPVALNPWGGTWQVFGAWVQVGLVVVMNMILAVAQVVTYHDLRLAKEGVGVDELVAVFA